MSFNVYVTRLIPRPGIELLERECETVEINPHDRPVTRQELLEAVRGRDGILCLLTDRIDEEVFKAAEGVKGFANYAVGYDNVDVAKATEYGIPVSNTPGVLTDATAEMAWALLFAVARRVVESDRFNRSGNWAGWGPMQFLGGDLTGATLGVVGAGRIGTAFALKSRGFDRGAAARIRLRLHPRAPGRGHVSPYLERPTRSHETDRVPHQHVARAGRR
jgi:glyoxylate reductase